MTRAQFRTYCEYAREKIEHTKGLSTFLFEIRLGASLEIRYLNLLHRDDPYQIVLRYHHNSSCLRLFRGESLKDADLHLIDRGASALYTFEEITGFCWSEQMDLELLLDA